MVVCCKMKSQSAWRVLYLTWQTSESSIHTEWVANCSRELGRGQSVLLKYEIFSVSLLLSPPAPVARTESTLLYTWHSLMHCGEPRGQTFVMHRGNWRGHQSMTDLHMRLIRLFDLVIVLYQEKPDGMSWEDRLTKQVTRSRQRLNNECSVTPLTLPLCTVSPYLQRQQTPKPAAQGRPWLPPLSSHWEWV